MSRMSASSSVIDVYDYDSDVMDEDEYIYGSNKRGIDSHRMPSDNNRARAVIQTNSSESPLYNRRQDINIFNTVNDSEVSRDVDYRLNERNLRPRETADFGFNSSDQAYASLPRFVQIGQVSRVKLCPPDISKGLDDVISSMTSDNERDVIVMPRVNVQNNTRQSQSFERRVVDASTCSRDRPRDRGDQEIIEVEPTVDSRTGTRLSTVLAVHPVKNTSKDDVFSKPSVISQADNHVARDTASYRDPMRQDSRVSSSARLTRDNDVPMEIDRSFEPRTSSVNSNVNNEKQHENESESLPKKKKDEPPRKIWITPVPAGMESTIIMNPGPMTGKKYRKRLKRALDEHVEDAKYYLRPESNPRFKDCEVDDVNCELLAYVDPSDKLEQNVKRTKNRDDEHVTTSKSPHVSSSSKGHSSNSQNPKSTVNNKLESWIKTNSKLETSDDETIRIRNVRLQAMLKLVRLDQQLDQLKSQNEVLRKRNGRSGTSHGDRLEDNERLQEKIKTQADDLRDILSAIDVLQTAIEPAKVDSTTTSVNNPQALAAKSPPTDYHFYDAGDHWCKFCSDVFETVADLLTHVHQQHISFIKGLSPDVRPWAVQPREKAGKRKFKFVPFKGGEFLYPCQGFFCDICKTYMGDEITAKVHLESLDHNTIYKKYCEDHPNYVKEIDANVANKKELKRKNNGLKFKTVSSLDTSNSVTAPKTKRIVKTTVSAPGGLLRKVAESAAESQAASSATGSSTSKEESGTVVESVASCKPADSVHLEQSTQSKDKSDDFDELSIDDDMLFKGEYSNMCQLELMDSWCVEDAEVEEDVEYGINGAESSK